MDNGKSVITGIKKIDLLCDAPEGEKVLSFNFENNVTGEMSYERKYAFEYPDTKIMITGKLKNVEVQKLE